MQTYAKVIADSTHGDGRYRLTTMEVCFHRFVLAEFNTHRVFSRNSASSRAIPLVKQIDKVRSSCAVPVSFPAEKPGMQGGAELDELDRNRAEQIWGYAAHGAAAYAEEARLLGLHKSVANRMLEPYQMHTVVVTSTAWENFFRLRLDALAQPEIRVAAEAMQEAYAASTPAPLERGLWHLPYIRRDSITAAEEHLLATKGQGGYGKRDVTKTLVAMSAAKCARVSYENQNGDKSVADELALYETLTLNGHVSPLEHVASPFPDNWHEVVVYDWEGVSGKTLILPKYGNLLAWHQHRFDVEISQGYQSYA